MAVARNTRRSYESCASTKTTDILTCALRPVVLGPARRCKYSLKLKPWSERAAKLGRNSFDFDLTNDSSSLDQPLFDCLQENCRSQLKSAKIVSNVSVLLASASARTVNLATHWFQRGHNAKKNSPPKDSNANKECHSALNMSFLSTPILWPLEMKQIDTKNRILQGTSRTRRVS